MIPNIFFLGKGGLYNIQLLQIFDFAILKGLVHISQFGISGFESPLLMRIQISQPHIINDHIFDESIPKILIKSTYRCRSGCLFLAEWSRWKPGGNFVEVIGCLLRM